MIQRATNQEREERRLAAQKEIDARHTAAERNRLGQFATPPALAAEITRAARALRSRRSGRIHMADPALGSGAFVSAFLHEFSRSRGAEMTGIEIDPAFAETAEQLWSDRGLRVIRGDFTRLVESGLGRTRPNLVLTNPPYVRHHHLGREQKSRLYDLTKKRTGLEVSGLAGLYVYYFLLAATWMEEGGLGAWLIPSEFMDVNYGRVLREYLTTQVSLRRVHRCDPAEVQFDDALVSSAVIFFEKTPATLGDVAEMTFGGSLTQPACAERVALSELRAARKWSQFPRRGGTRGLKGGAATLGDLFSIKRGIATGANDFFILAVSEARDLGLPEECLKPILPSPRHLRETIIESDKRGYPVLDTQLCLIDSDEPEETMRVKHEALWKHLESARSRGVTDGYLVQRRSPWYRQEQRSPAPFLVTYMGRGVDEKRPFRFIWNKSRAIATNLYLLLYPRGPMAQLLQRTPKQASKVYALLAAITADELRRNGRVYGGALHKIEPSELANVSAVAFLKEWPEMGARATQGEFLFQVQEEPRGRPSPALAGVAS